MTKNATMKIFNQKTGKMIDFIPNEAQRIIARKLRQCSMSIMTTQRVYLKHRKLKND